MPPTRAGPGPAVAAYATVRLPSAVGASSRATISGGAPCGTRRTRSAETIPASTTIRLAVSVNTVTRAAASQSRRSVAACCSEGSDNTVCRVTTMGTSSSAASASTYSPASPPKMPNSCSINTTSVPLPLSSWATAT